jgi:hypothetical protein
MKYKFYLISFLLCSIYANSYAQVGGENIYQFLNLPSSARQIALGGEVLTLMDDINQPIWNPAVINSDIDNKISVNYSSYLAGINIGSLSYTRYMEVLNDMNLNYYLLCTELNLEPKIGSE